MRPKRNVTLCSSPQQHPYSRFGNKSYKANNGLRREFGKGRSQGINKSDHYLNPKIKFRVSKGVLSKSDACKMVQRCIERKTLYFYSFFQPFKIYNFVYEFSSKYNL